MVILRFSEHLTRTTDFAGKAQITQQRFCRPWRFCHPCFTGTGDSWLSQERFYEALQRQKADVLPFCASQIWKGGFLLPEPPDPWMELHTAKQAGHLSVMGLDHTATTG